MTHRRRHRAHL